MSTLSVRHSSTNNILVTAFFVNKGPSVSWLWITTYKTITQLYHDPFDHASTGTFRLYSMYCETIRFITEEFLITLFAFDYYKNDPLCSLQYFCFIWHHLFSFCLQVINAICTFFYIETFCIILYYLFLFNDPNIRDFFPFPFNVINNSWIYLCHIMLYFLFYDSSLFPLMLDGFSL